MDTLLHILTELWVVLGAMAPYLLFGFLVAGILSVLVSPETVEKHLGGNGIVPVLKAAAFGVPLPLCSCGVIPVAASLRRHGASRGATTAFLISTPQTGVDSIFVTWSLLGPVFAVFRPIMALVSGVVGGVLVTLGIREEDPSDGPPVRCTDECCNPGGGSGGRVRRALRYGFATLPRDIGKALLVGLVIAALITVLLPPQFFARHVTNPVLQVLVMMLLGIPIYVCATASVPVAAALILTAGVSPGAALAFLITGPGTNAAGLAMVWKVMGRRTALIYLFTLAVTAFGSGLLLDAVFDATRINPKTWISAASHVHGMASWEDWLSNVSAVALLGVLGVAIIRPSLGKMSEPAQGAVCEGHAHETLILTVEGMTCSHCVETVARALREQSGVESADVSLETKTAVVGGDELDPDALVRAVESVGYQARLGPS